MKRKYYYFVTIVLTFSLLFTSVVFGQTITTTGKDGEITQVSPEAELAQQEFNGFISNIIEETISIDDMINRIDLFLNGFSLSSDYTISTQENNVIIDDEEFSQIAIDISNVVLSHPDGDYAGLVATTEIVSLSSSVEYAPYGNSQICPYYAIRAYVNGSYAYYYSNGEKKVCPYSISGKNVIYDSSFSVISQVATSTYTDGGFYTIGTRDYYIGAYLIWGAYYTGFTQYVTANEFSWLKVINSVTVQRGTSTTYSFSVTGLTQGY